MALVEIDTDQTKGICSKGNCSTKIYRAQRSSLLKGLDICFCANGHLWVWTDDNGGDGKDPDYDKMWEKTGKKKVSIERGILEEVPDRKPHPVQVG